MSSVAQTSGFGKTLDEIGVFVWRNLSHIPRMPERLADVTVQPIMFVLLFAFVFGASIATGGGASYREFCCRASRRRPSSSPPSWWRRASPRMSRRASSEEILDEVERNLTGKFNLSRRRRRDG